MGLPPPADLPRGECICTSQDGRLRIDRADPRIFISAELLGVLAAGPSTAWPRDATLDRADCTEALGHAGAVLKLHGVNRTVIYRITEYVPRVRGYIGEWPD
jgi:hypothetical protein